MKKIKSILTKVGFGVVFYLSLQIMTVQTAILFDSLGTSAKTSAISLYEARFSKARTELELQSELGYISCPRLNEENHTYHYFLTQYALTPTIIEDSLEHEFILGNFPPELCTLNDLDLENFNLSLSREFGSGIFLLERK